MNRRQQKKADAARRAETLARALRAVDQFEPTEALDLIRKRTVRKANADGLTIPPPSCEGKR